MAKILDWQEMKKFYARLLLERTGDDINTWMQRVNQQGFDHEQSLRSWLTQQGVTGYPQAYIVMEKFGYPDFMSASAYELIDAQYADRPHLRPILDAIIAAAVEFGELTIQTRKTYVSLVTPRRTFARVQPTTKNRVDLALRLADQKPGGRFVPSHIQETMHVQIGLSSVEELDEEVIGWLKKAYDESAA